MCIAIVLNHGICALRTALAPCQLDTTSLHSHGSTLGSWKAKALNLMLVLDRVNPALGYPDRVNPTAAGLPLGHPYKRNLA